MTNNIHGYLVEVAGHGIPYFVKDFNKIAEVLEKQRPAGWVAIYDPEIIPVSRYWGYLADNCVPQDIRCTYSVFVHPILYADVEVNQRKEEVK